MFPRRSAPLTLTVAGALCAWIASASTASALTLTIDPARSSVTDGLTRQSLSGALEISLGAGAGAGTTTFDVTALSLFAAGLSVTLDPTAPSPGAGVVAATGAFLIPTLFVAFEVGPGLEALGLPDVAGSVEFASGGIGRLEATVDIDPGAGGALRSFTLVALPEPTLVLWGLALPVVGRTLGRSASGGSR